MAIRIKNVTQNNYFLLGQLIKAGEIYTLQRDEPSRFAEDEITLTKIVNSEAVINDGISDLDIADGINLLTGAGIKTVKVEEEKVTTIGNQYQTKGMQALIPGFHGWHTIDFSFTYPISIFSATFIDSDLKFGDICHFEISPETAIGTIASPVTPNDVTFTLSSGTSSITKPGRYITIDDGSNSDFVGSIQTVDLENDQITCAIAAANSFTVGAVVKMTTRMVDSWYFEGSPAPVSLGEGVIGGSYVPANAILRIKYFNSNGVAKKFNFAIEGKY